MNNNNQAPGTVVTTKLDANGKPIAEATKKSRVLPAKPLTVTVDGLVVQNTDSHNLYATPKEFSTGSIGWYCTGKMEDKATGKKYQIGMNITEIGSKLF